MSKAEKHSRPSISFPPARRKANMHHTYRFVLSLHFHFSFFSLFNFARKKKNAEAWIEGERKLHLYISRSRFSYQNYRFVYFLYKRIQNKHKTSCPCYNVPLFQHSFQLLVSVNFAPPSRTLPSLRAIVYWKCAIAHNVLIHSFARCRNDVDKALVLVLALFIWVVLCSQTLWLSNDKRAHLKKKSFLIIVNGDFGGFVTFLSFYHTFEKK